MSPATKLTSLAAHVRDEASTTPGLLHPMEQLELLFRGVAR